MGILIEAKQRFEDGRRHYRQHPRAPFVGCPIREAYQEHLDSLNYVHEARRQGLLGPVSYALLQLASLTSAWLLRRRIEWP